MNIFFSLSVWQLLALVFYFTKSTSDAQDYELSRPQSRRFIKQRHDISTVKRNALFGVIQQPSITAGQCPVLDMETSLPLRPNDLVQVDPVTGLRRFNARIVGIFSCFQSNSVSNDLTLDFRLAKPVIDLAVKTVNMKYPNMHFNVTYRTAPDVCKEAPGHAADEYYVNGANYLLGPGCSESLASVGQLASYWNIPICSTGYLPEIVTASFNPMTLIQLSLSVQSVGEMLLEMFQMYKWRHLVILTDEKHPLHSVIRDGLLEYFRTMYLSSRTGVGSKSGSNLYSNNNSTGVPNNGAGRDQMPPRVSARKSPYYINITERNFAYSRNKPIDYEQIMLEAASYSRIILILARSSTIGNLLVAAHNQGMSKGQFVFIAHELFETQQFEPTTSGHQKSAEPATSQNLEADSDSTLSAKQSLELSDRPMYHLDDKIEIQSLGANSSSDQVTREILQPLMTISLRIPTTPEFDSFRSEVVRISESQFNYRIKATSLKSLYSLGVAALIYDCVMLYADKVDYVLKRTQHKKIDGKTIFDLAAGNTFTGALTGNLTINGAGQRVIDFTLNDFSSKSLSLEPIAHYFAIERRLTFLPGQAPHWVLRNQSTPKSDPRCRLNDLFCRYNDEADNAMDAYGNYHPLTSDRFVLGVWLLVIIIVSVGLTSSTIGFLVYRRFRIESELLNLWWSIKYEDILFEDEADLLCDGKRSMSSLAMSNESFNDKTNTHNEGQNSTAGSGRASPINRSPASSGQVNKQHHHDLESIGDEQNAKLNVCHSLGGRSEGNLAMSTAGSTSTLSVGATSINAGPRVGSHPGSRVGGSSGHPRLAAIPGPCKLLPLIGKSHPSSSSKSNKTSGHNCRTSATTTSGAGNAKEPSISSQNKNVKLRLGTILNGGRDEFQTTKVGLYKASRVAAKHLNVKNLNINRQLLIELRQVRDLTHENLIKFIGLCPEEPNVAIVSELCTRGNLQDLLQNETIRLDWPFRYSIINDIIDGLTHLHASPVQYHGRLKSSNCVIDNRFVVKLTDFGLPTLLAAVETEENVNPRLLLWTAPEHLRTKHPLLSGSQKGDIYSLAIILQEIITRCGPFECEPILCGTTEMSAPMDWQVQHQSGFTNMAPPLIRTTDAGGKPITSQGRRTNTAAGSRLLANPARHQPGAQILMQPVVVQHKQRLEPEEIVNLVRMGLSPPFRPYFRPDVTSSSGAGKTSLAGGHGTGDFNVAELIAIVQNCWQESPAGRPSVTSVKQQIKKMRRGCHLEGANLMDNLLQRMERYTDNLESLVEQKTAELMEEKKRSEELLYEMLPRFVVDQLKYGHSVTPEAYEAVTISFSDIKDFTSIAAQSSPIEVVNLLNQLYTEFDDCIARYDVYKVETIGDAYMVVSGLPVRNGDLHAKEIAEMSLALLELIRNFEIVHLPQVSLELRIGIHSGPCASGVVGTRMFRYCLFGDTVNTASRMESHGEPMKIHISEDSANILATFGTFNIEPRGQIDIKGKGAMNTFWLTGKTVASQAPLAYKSIDLV